VLIAFVGACLLLLVFGGARDRRRPRARR
jgi:hypothetical protein